MRKGTSHVYVCVKGASSGNCSFTNLWPMGSEFSRMGSVPLYEPCSSHRGAQFRFLKLKKNKKRSSKDGELSCRNTKHTYTPVVGEGNVKRPKRKASSPAECSWMKTKMTLDGL